MVRILLFLPLIPMQFNSSFVAESNFHLFVEPSFHINHSLHFPAPYQMVRSELPSGWLPHVGGEVCEVAVCIQVEPLLCLGGRKWPLPASGHYEHCPDGLIYHRSWLKPQHILLLQMIFCFKWHRFQGNPHRLCFALDTLLFPGPSFCMYLICFFFSLDMFLLISI